MSWDTPQVVETGPETADLITEVPVGPVVVGLWMQPLNHDGPRSQWMPRVRLAFTIDRAAGLVCATGSGSLLVLVDGATAATLAFSTSTGGAGDDRPLSVSVAADQTVEFRTAGSFTGFRGTVSGPRY